MRCLVEYLGFCLVFRPNTSLPRGFWLKNKKSQKIGQTPRGRIQKKSQKNPGRGEFTQGAFFLSENGFLAVFQNISVVSDEGFGENGQCSNILGFFGFFDQKPRSREVFGRKIANICGSGWVGSGCIPALRKLVSQKNFVANDDFLKAGGHRYFKTRKTGIFAPVCA